MRSKPIRELVEALSQAYPRCRHLQNGCANIRFDPKAGFIPRGYCGAFGAISDVKLVLVLAEPGNPPFGQESYDLAKTPIQLIKQISHGVAREIETGKSGFHINLRTILNNCWRGLPFPEQMKRTWITESVLCSADEACASIPKTAQNACVETYLRRQLQMLPSAYTVALGGKAARRMKTAELKMSFQAAAPGLPGGNFAASKESWKSLGSNFQKWLKQF